MEMTQKHRKDLSAQMNRYLMFHFMLLYFFKFSRARALNLFVKTVADFFSFCYIAMA